MIENNSGKHAVLFVDDEEKALKYFCKAVGGRVPVFTAANIDAAKEILKTKSDEIAVVISDQRMPGGNGVELLKWIRSQYPAIVRLLTTAYSDLNDAIEAINRGEIYRYIQKPWRVESLQAEVKGAFDYFQLQRERDLLLAEKLSTRQRMTGIERIGQLLVFAQTFDGMKHADYAVKDFLGHLHMLPGAWESDGLGRMDQWELTTWETRRLTEFVRQVKAGLLQSVPDISGFPHRMNPEQLAEINDGLANEAACKLSIEDAGAAIPPEWSTNRQLMETVLRAIFAVFSQLPDGSDSLRLKIFSAVGRDGKAPAIGMSFQAERPSWPNDRHLISGSAMTEVHPIYQQALIGSLAAAHHGGQCTFSYDTEQLTITLRLPVSADPADFDLPALGWEWLPNVLSYYEPPIEEFYSDL